MPYCTLANIEDAIPSLRGRWGQGQPAGPASAKVDGWIAESDDRINSVLAKIKPSGETLPLATVPPRIRQVSVDLTAARVLRFTLGQGVGEAARNLANDLDKEATQILAEIAAGTWEDLFPSDAETTSALPATLSTGFPDDEYRWFTREDDA